MRIIHFSDIHVGVFPKTFGVLRDKRILGSINFFLTRKNAFRQERVTKAVRKIRELEPDCVICTGDLTSVSLPDEFKIAEAAIAPIADAFPGRFIYVPGNHDAYVPRESAAKALREIFERLNHGRWKLDNLPAELQIENLKFIALNQALPTNCLLSAGKLSNATKVQLEKLLNAPRGNNEKRILVGHFPVRDQHGRPLGWRRSLRGWQILDDALENGKADVALCGHIHTPFVRKVNDQSMEICAGSLTASGKMNMLEYSADTGAFTQSWVDVSL